MLQTARHAGVVGVGDIPADAKQQLPSLGITNAEGVVFQQGRASVFGLAIASVQIYAQAAEAGLIGDAIRSGQKAIGVGRADQHGPLRPGQHPGAIGLLIALQVEHALVKIGLALRLLAGEVQIQQARGGLSLQGVHDGLLGGNYGVRVSTRGQGRSIGALAGTW
ncbi:hypothetical protein D3C84_794540 [compost metagenome]